MNPITEFWHAISAKYPSPPYNEDWKKDYEWWSSEFLPHTDVDYDNLLEYSQRRYENLDQAISSINEKAEWMFGLTTAAVGFMTTRTTGHRLIDSVLGLAVLSALMTLWLALRSRLPETRPLPMSVRDAMEQAHRNLHPKAWMTASMHLVIEGLVVVDRWKGKQLNAASKTLILMCACFAIHGLGAGLLLPRFPQSDGSVQAEHSPLEARSPVEQAKR